MNPLSYYPIVENVFNFRGVELVAYLWLGLEYNKFALIYLPISIHVALKSCMGPYSEVMAFFHCCDVHDHARDALYFRTRRFSMSGWEKGD